MHKKQLLTMLATTAFAVTAALSVPTSELSAATSGKARPARAINKAPATASAARTTPAPKPNGVYIVRMADAPVAGYDGRIKGYAATRPAAGAKIDLARPETQNYRALLRQKQDAVLAKVGAQKIYSYDLVFNGFAAKLTDAQAEKLATMPGVLSVSKDEMRYADTSSTPAFLGLTAPGSLWWQAGGPRDAGDGVVVGVIDSGIWPENPSFANNDRHPRGHGGRHEHHRGDGHGYGHSDPGIHGWTGYCEDGEDFVGDDACNGKIIGARYFNEGWGGDAGIDAQRPWEFNSPRDYNGHGTHTTGTAAGNYKTKTTGVAASFGPVNGMAPGARIATYKALWSTESGDTASGNTSDLVAAIDQAVADGVDVINYSVSGTTTNFRDPVEISFLYAADAGVFVAASAGNSGPTVGTVAHPSPWITTVAAGTHNRAVQGGSVTLGNGVTYTGSGYLLTTGPNPMVDAGAAGLPGADPATLALCFGAADDGVARLDPAKVAGKIVVCNRGSNVLVNKAAAVKAAGGAGMVLVNTPTSANTLPFVAYSIPAVHLPVANYTDIKDYAATATATATINSANIVYNVPAPYTASFSSRGPLAAGAGDLLKPDIIAPGQDILAAYSPAIGGVDFDLLSGTSMSSPHIAGLAAVMKDVHPRWSPMMIKSALMTTATDVLDGPPTDPTVIFRQGAGHVAPNSAIDPGLVFDSGWNDWLGFLCGTQLPASYCTSSGIPVLDPSDFNGPSIAIGDLAGSQTVTRTLKNVSWRGTYKVSVTGLAGTTVTVAPSVFTINPNKSQKVSITITRTTAPLNAYVGGYITWSDGYHNVRVPVVVKPVALAAPTQVSGSYSVKFGYDGPFSATARGLVPAMTFPGTVVDNDYALFVVTVPAGTTYARFSLFDSDVSPASDLDLRVFRVNPNNTLTQVGASGGGTSAEEVNLLNPTAADYYLVVDGYATGNPSSFTAYAWALGSAAAGNMAVTAPAAAVLGATGNIGLSFTGLTAGVKYLGSVAYDGTTGMPNPTIVRVDP